MAFNISSWGKKGRDYGRGAPPPKGSIEWIAVGDMWQADPPRAPSPAATSQSGFQVYEISFTELNAANNWLNQIANSLSYAVKVHGGKVISKDDIDGWNRFMSRWNGFYTDLDSKLTLNMMSKDNKKRFDTFLKEAKVLNDGYVKKGMAQVPVPYAGELVMLLRTMPKTITAEGMHGKLQAGIRCGKQLLDANTPWWKWRVRDDSHGLVLAIEKARKASDIMARSLGDTTTYSPGDPVYDNFLKVLALIWIEASGLYGIEETYRAAKAEAIDAGLAGGKSATSMILWLLATAGVGYLGVKWVLHRPSTVRVGVPDVYPPQG